jgi:hypothetical protein
MDDCVTQALFFRLNPPALYHKSHQLVNGIKILVNHGVVRAGAQLMQQRSRFNVRVPAQAADTTLAAAGHFSYTLCKEHDMLDVRQPQQASLASLENCAQ